MSQNDRFARAVARFAPGATMLDHRPLDGGVSAEVHGLTVRTAAGDEQRFVLRRHQSSEWKPHAANATLTEHRLLAALHHVGLTVPKPLSVDESGDLFGSPYFVLEFVEGSTELTDAAFLEAMTPIAEFLARLHALDSNLAALPDLPAREDPVQNLPKYLPATDLGDAVRARLAAHPDFAGPRAKPAITHGDYWPGNLLWRDGRLVAVIDWEDAALGDPMCDVACARVELLCAHGQPAMDRFTKQCSQSRRALRSRPGALVAWEIYEHRRLRSRAWRSGVCLPRSRLRGGRARRSSSSRRRSASY